ncbi:ABC-2 transporter permease [Clostridium peptidivorans]|uniref:ABC-2 transporter permease n=1 Tax=Clostridium peptidivorans TaxID=100174 RepID=UPI000BE46035|nr:ABC-2 transporter permease [Clostridium peptidivorans]
MINLIKKDILIQKRTLPFLCIFVIIFALNNQINSQGSIYIIGVTIGYILTVGALAYDEVYNGNILINSLPITRKNVVFSRYISIFFFTALSLIFLTFMSLIFNLIGISDLKIKYISITDIKTIASTVLILSSIMIPLFLKFGTKLGKLFNFIVFFMFFSISSFIMQNKDERLIKNISSFIVNNNGVHLTIIGIIILACIYALSMYFSFKIYDNKDF